VNAHRFITGDGVRRYGRYRVRPAGANEYLDGAVAATHARDFLFDEIRETLAKGPVKIRVAVQIAAKDDIVDDATAHWPNDRREVPFGTIEMLSALPDNEAAQRHIIFDPIPRVEGIEPSGDPLLDLRADVYLISGRRRRAAGSR